MLRGLFVILLGVLLSACVTVTDEGALAVECSFRAKPGFNVGNVAHELGGGGHPQASGCTIVGDLDDITAKVVVALKDARREQVSGQ